MKRFFLLGILIFTFIDSQCQMPIIEARQQQIGSTVTVTGIVTNGPELGVIRYLQDLSAGIAVYSSSLSSIRRGDSITVTGTLKSYNNLLEIDPVANFVILSRDNPLPQPLLITPSEVGEALESQLIQINMATISGASGTFSGNTNYTIVSGGQTTTMRVVNSSPLVGRPIPTRPFTLVAIVSQYSTSNPAAGYQLLPRDANDIIVSSGINVVSDLLPFEIDVDHVSLQWQTDSVGTTEYFWGLTPELEMGHVNANSSGTIHQITINTQPATLIYVNAFSVNGQDTAFTGNNIFISKSLSSGDIKVYFNQEVDHSVSTGDDAISLINQFTDTTIAYINRAQQTIDIIMYDNDCRPIIDALNDAHVRGVQIRFITDAPNVNEQPDSVLQYLHPGIPILYGNVDAIMHNKIIIIDRDDVNRCQVIVGSTNHTIANLNKDYNSIIIIQDQSLVKAYMLEFYEMWGSLDFQPNPSNAKFGNQKTNNTPHHFNIGGKHVELYFSPSDRTTSKIAKALQTAQSEIEFNVMAFTEDVLGQAIKNLHLAGVNTRGIIDYVEYSGSEFQMLLNAGVDVIDYQNPDGSQWPIGATLHHKYAIVDYNHSDSDPLVIVGSHNWTASAETRNDENTLIIYDATIANLYHQEFTQTFNRLLTPQLQNDSITGQVNTTAFIDYRSNDFIHPQVSSIQVSIVAQPTHGNAMLAGDIIIYSPQTNFAGTDSLKYRICIQNRPGLCGEAWVYIGILPQTSVGHLASSTALTISPNPASQSIEILAPINGKATVDFYSISGEKVKSLLVDFQQGKATILLNDLAQGYYSLMVTNQFQLLIGKLIKQ
ncbi:MAG TPA: phospholipase D-like domain-containing protein [Salinivirgaceae bacterium]|nr:phospholipase D-like domain-containing protein [Salinivirgaceae bacterium]